MTSEMKGTNQERLDSFKSETLSCTKCGLCQLRKNVVFGEGNPESPLMIVGEGPGDNEDQTGRPFVGVSGAMLDRALVANQMDRRHVFIANIVKCRAHDIIDGRAVNRPPTPAEVEACKPWLIRQIETIKPLVLVCVGSPSANTLIHPNFRITKERGLWFESPYAEAIGAVLHPSYIIRNEGPHGSVMFEQLISDIGMARMKVVEIKKRLRNPQP
jgi:DNA polymerase